MTIYFHHVGEVGSSRDFPRTIFDGVEQSSMRLFSANEILPELSDLSEAEILRINNATRATPWGFQIWGIPSGGSRLFRRVSENDYWLLIDTDRPGVSIGYAGRIICKIDNPSFHLSNFLWGEAKFPLIILLDGFGTSLEITEFKEIFGYKPNWSMRGLAYPLAEQRISDSKFRTEALFIRYLRTLSDNEVPTVPETLDEPPPDEFVIEGGLALAIHLSRERDRTLVNKFKESLKSFECTACSFDFERVYGELGKYFIECHHITPLGEGRQRETRITDLRAVCSNCHRMLHRGLGVSVEDLRAILKRQSVK